MPTRALRQYEQAEEDERREGKTALAHRLIEEVADRGAERAREDEGCPEQEHPRHIRPDVKRNDHGEPGGEDEGAACSRVHRYRPSSPRARCRASART